MRIRTKKWAKPELIASNFFVDKPDVLKGKWSEFFNNKREIHLDLGCGKCTFMAELSHEKQNINHIAVDISMDILGVARRNISEKFGDKNVENVAICSYNIEQIDEIVSKEDKVSRIYINFCNPWPAAGYHKRRLTHTKQLEKYKAILQNGGEIWFKTDNDDLFLSSKRYFNEAGLDIFFVTEDLNSEDVENFKSEHEVMFEAQGIKTKAIRAKYIKKTAETLTLDEIKFRMKNERIYYCNNEILVDEQNKIMDKVFEYNHTKPSDTEKKETLIKELMGKIGKNFYITTPFYASWGGKNVYIGDNFYSNFNLMLVDDGNIYIGDNVLIAPGVTISSGTHPIDPYTRSKGAQYNLDVTIGNNVWIGANAAIMPGVKIGDNSIIGAGSVVTKSIPENVLAVGNPCRILREINDNDKIYFNKNMAIDIE